MKEWIKQPGRMWRVTGAMESSEELRRSPQGVQTVGREAGEGLGCGIWYTHTKWQAEWVCFYGHPLPGLRWMRWLADQRIGCVGGCLVTFSSQTSVVPNSFYTARHRDWAGQTALKIILGDEKTCQTQTNKRKHPPWTGMQDESSCEVVFTNNVHHFIFDLPKIALHQVSYWGVNIPKP